MSTSIIQSTYIFPAIHIHIHILSKPRFWRQFLVNSSPYSFNFATFFHLLSLKLHGELLLIERMQKCKVKFLGDGKLPSAASVKSMKCANILLVFRWLIPQHYSELALICACRAKREANGGPTWTRCGVHFASARPSRQSVTLQCSSILHPLLLVLPAHPAHPVPQVHLVKTQIWTSSVCTPHKPSRAMTSCTSRWSTRHNIRRVPILPISSHLFSHHTRNRPPLSLKVSPYFSFTSHIHFMNINVFACPVTRLCRIPAKSSD